MAVDRRRLLIGGAAAVLLILAAWWFWPSSAPAPAATRSAARPRAASGRAARDAASGPVDVKLEALQDVREEPGEGSRNPFRYQPRVVAPPPRPVAPPVSETQRPSAPPVPAGPPPPPPIPLKFLGLVTRADGTKWAVLTDGKSPPMYGRDGDIIDGRYVIVKIGTESIEMTYTDGRGRQVIRLSGQ